ncbi:MAG: hypothetical protein IJV94_00140 [Bacilli bacterium]|nr:hypothetical protein [Bacilli bacterium]
MKKIIITIFLVLMTGCSVQVNPRKVAYPFSIYLFKNDQTFQNITKTNDEYGVAILSSTPYKSATVELESGLDVKLFIAVNTGENYAEALSNIHIEGCNLINFHYVKSLILHHNLLTNDDFESALSFIYFNKVIRPNIYLYTTNKDFKEIYNVTSSNGKSPYFNMINSAIFPSDFERMKQITLNDFLSSYLDNNRASYLIDLDITKDNEYIKDDELEENAQYKINGLFYTTTNRKTKLFQYLKIDYLDGLSYYNKCTGFNFQTEDNKYQIFIDEIIYSRNIVNNHMTFKIKASIHGSLFDKNLLYIQNNIQEKILKDIQNTYNYAMEKDVDIYHILDYGFRQNKKIETSTSFSVNLNFIFQNNSKL